MARLPRVERTGRTVLNFSALIAALFCLTLGGPAVAGAAGLPEPSTDHTYDSPSSSTAANATHYDRDAPPVRGDSRRATTQGPAAVGSGNLRVVSATGVAAETVTDVAARRATLRVGTKAEIQEAAPKTAGGDSSTRTPAK
jgi:hypothetical protein